MDKFPNEAAKGELTKGVSIIPPPTAEFSSGRVGLNRGGLASRGASDAAGFAEESTFWLIVEDDVVLSALGGEVYLKIKPNQFFYIIILLPLIHFCMTHFYINLPFLIEDVLSRLH